LLVYESVRNYDKLIQEGPKRKTLSRIIIQSFELTPEGAMASYLPSAMCLTC